MNKVTQYSSIILALLLSSCATQSSLFLEDTSTSISKRTTYLDGELVSSEEGITEFVRVKLKSENGEIFYAQGKGSVDMGYETTGEGFKIHSNGEHEGEAYVPPEVVEKIVEGVVAGLTAIP